MPSHVGKPVDIMVSPKLQEDLRRKLDLASFNIETMIENVQHLIDEEEKNLDPNWNGTWRNL